MGVVVMIVLVFGGRFLKTVPPGHVGVAALFGEVMPNEFGEGLHIPVNPFYNWVLFDVRMTTLKESAQVPTRDQLQTKIDLSVQWRIDGKRAPEILQNTGDVQRVINVQLIPFLRSLVREEGSKVARAEDFFLEETREKLENGLLDRMRDELLPKGLIIGNVLIRDINLPTVLSKAIEQKKEREQAVERQKAELERFKQEQQQKVAQANAQLEAARAEAEQIRVLASAKADEIRLINDAIAKNPAYIQLQSLEALKQMSKDPAAKIYFMDSNSSQPLPLMHLGESPR
ncbi:MAG: SPFH domain-containing protein [Myxococcota bacterium]|nr:SPFH domain-containing protein [Myxococcota bacterium]